VDTGVGADTVERGRDAPLERTDHPSSEAAASAARVGPGTSPTPRMQRSARGDRRLVMDESETPDNPSDEPPSSEAGAQREHGGLHVSVADRTGRLPDADASWLRSSIERCARMLAQTGSVRAAVIDDAAMADAHQRYAGVPGTTDVLTFDYRERQAEPLDVDLLLCLDEASRQAAPRGHGMREELLLYAVHGLLHCMGHDDHDPADAERMHTEEDRILTELGVGPIFAAARSGGER